ncbi:hypothetical protein GRX01_04140 [Halobaculum sp. WSA2]|uniref:Uncharacterized protein n=1 Tax=Halobaculum saliterrae TaxID=2073113 RepID=A0A6B0SQ10_9EURY|nr:hypothetical protein [Halobaculum saliterrae]MXR40537.1 hypothetical protein [Halobaculum saliterrae]
MPGRRRRSRAGGGGSSRRRFLYLLGGAAVSGALISSSGAFSTSRLSRPVDVQSASDPNALLGLSIPPFVDAGQSGQELVTVTNNASTPLTVSVELPGASGTVSPASRTIQPEESRAFTVTLSADAAGGENALTFDVTATAGSSTKISLSRSLGVRNFLRNLEDRTTNNNAFFYLSYRLQNVDTFQSFEVVVRNLDRGWIPTRTYTSTDVEHVFRIPESGSDGGTAGSTYEFEMRVYDADGLALQRVLTDVADGNNPQDNDAIGGGPNDPVVVGFTITDNEQYTNAHYVVDYEVGNTSSLQEVRVTFDNRSNSWADETETSTDTPTGTVTYDQGGVGGDTYDITVEVVNENGIVTDSLTKTDVADGADP